MRDDDAELTPEELAIVAKVRALPPEGVEPDWGQLEIAIRDAVGPTVPVAWWRRWKWLVPIGGLATTAAIALLWLHHPGAPREAARPDAAIAAHAEPAVPAAVATTVYLDGQIIDVGELDDTGVLDDPDAELPAVGDEDPAAALPVADLGWVDNLDDSAMERVEHWLERKKT